MSESKGKPGGPLHLPLLNRCHFSAWNFQPAGTRPSWEKKKPPPFHTPCPGALGASVGAAPLHPLILQVEKLRQRKNQAPWGHRTQMAELGSERRLSASVLGGEAPGSIQVGIWRKELQSWGRSTFLSGLPWVLESPRPLTSLYRHLLCAKPVTGTSGILPSCCSLPLLATFFKGRN